MISTYSGGITRLERMYDEVRTFSAISSGWSRGVTCGEDQRGDRLSARRGDCLDMAPEAPCRRRPESAGASGRRGVP